MPVPHITREPCERDILKLGTPNTAKIEKINGFKMVLKNFLQRPDRINQRTEK
jgi:hypothetical protein